MRAHAADPIVAIATAAGRAGIGVVRLSLGRAHQTAIVNLMRALFGKSLAARHAEYVSFLEAGGACVDRGIALYFPGPRSYTGEDVLELQGHGGPVVLQLLLRRCLEAGRDMGLRLAEPGEFTQRAFLNNKLDLAQAEAVADLIEASTEAAARSASRSLDGAFSRAIDSLVEKLVTLRMLTEATLDFPEEEIDFLQAADATGQLVKIRNQFDNIRQQAKQGALLGEGITVVLAGAPNVGKSSLLNSLAGMEVAIVTPVAGTTRDRIAQTIQIEGVPLHIIDTAGLRETDDTIERLGIARTWSEIKKADVILHIGDAQCDWTEDDAALAARFPGSVPVLRVLNKIDLLDRPATAKQTASDVVSDTSGRCILLSAKLGWGLDLLRQTLLDLVGSKPNEQGFIARTRHLHALTAAGAHIETAQRLAGQGNQSLDLFAEELRLAQTHLNTITGEFSSDDLLGQIFGRFCIGK